MRVFRFIARQMRFLVDGSRTSAVATAQLRSEIENLRGDLAAIAERRGASAQFGAELLALQQQLFGQWHQWKDGTIDWQTLRR